MNKDITIDDFKEALSQLPPEFRDQLQEESSVDNVGIKLELIKFVVDLHKHNQGVDWETNKVKPKNIEVKEIISDSKSLFDFLTE